MSNISAVTFKPLIAAEAGVLKATFLEMHHVACGNPFDSNEALGFTISGNELVSHLKAHFDATCLRP